MKPLCVVQPRSRIGFRHGFTLIELLIVMAILGVLAAAVLPLGETMITARKEQELKQALWEIRSAIDHYKQASDAGVIPRSADTVGYPPTLQALALGAADTRDLSGAQKIYFLRQVPRDPFADAKLPAEDSWRLRSYASPPDKPQPGSDVYDVKSSSDGTALDGSRYSSW